MASSIDNCRGCRDFRRWVWKHAGGKRQARRKFKNIKLDYARHYDRVYYTKGLFC